MPNLYSFFPPIINTACMTQKNQLSKIRDYDRHKSRACVDLFLKVTRSNILTIIINRDEIFLIFPTCIHVDIDLPISQFPRAYINFHYPHPYVQMLFLHQYVACRSYSSGSNTSNRPPYRKMYLSDNRNASPLITS
jgi:hypothetical protein